MERSEPSETRSILTGKRIQASLAIAAAVASVWGFWALREPWGPDPNKTKIDIRSLHSSSSPYKNTGAGVAFVGDEACARCHAEITQAYRQHPMGRSAANPDKVLPGQSGVVFGVKDLTYSIDRRGGRLFHQETRGDGSGLHAKTEAEVRYVIGSGTRGYAFLVEREGNLFQSPIAWYSQGRKWDLAPDYRERNWHFERVITPGCLFCHTNRFDQAEGELPVFHGLTIGCERCHGPGELHVRRPEVIDGKDLTIVNPADLEPLALRENVCEQCHFQGKERFELPGRSVFDYRPGLPLDEFLRIYPARSDPTLRYVSVGHVEQIRQSRCYRDSRGKLGCISCHDPHRLPEPAARVAYYRARCLECHAERGCRLPHDARLSRSPEDNCVTCHMPRTRTTNIAHTALSNHTIPRIPEATR
jgi:predicted CXXCH cytochrome family protein